MKATLTSARFGYFLTIAIVLISVVIQIVSGWAEALAWERGELGFTVLTGHLVHWSWDHLIWDVIGFGALAFAAIRIIPERFVTCLLLAAIVIPLEVQLFRPQFTSYRGLSGLDSALFGLVAIGLWRQGGSSRWIAGIALAVFVGKTGYESLTGATIFVDEVASGFVPVVSAHVTGMVCGIIAGYKKRLVCGVSNGFEFTGFRPTPGSASRSRL